MATVECENLESVKKSRTATRRSFTVTANKFEKGLKSEPTDIGEITALYQLLQNKSDSLSTYDAIIFKYLTSEDTSDDLLDRELEEVDNYKVKFYTLQTKFHEVTKEDDRSETYKTVQKLSTEKRKFILPKIELSQFDGHIENWIGFWGQFRKIHEDTSIDDDDKFQYLIKATEPGTAARDLVESFPPSGPNYYKAMEQLKYRFAKDELIIQTYVRKLLTLVLQQTQGNAEGFELCALYDKLNTQLRALETLGVTTDKYAAMLYPLVESALPENVLRVWERSTKVPDTDMLTQLMDFLKLEVECEEKILIAKNSFRNASKSLEPTAACTCSASQEHNPSPKHLKSGYKQAERLCIWCDKSSHNSRECIITKKMSLDQKKEFLKSKKACLICLKTGHFANKCRSFPKCLNYTKRHTLIMCPLYNNNIDVNKPTSTSPSHVMSNLHSDCQTDPKRTDQKEEDQKSNKVLLSYRSTTTTLLQTLIVHLFYNGKVVKTRALLDSGAQRSYVSKDVIKSLGISPTKSESLLHSLFGGVETTLSKDNIYKIGMSDLSGKFECIISVLDKDKICEFLPRLTDPLIFGELAKHNITLTDNDNSSSDIGLLIGADYSGFLYTGEIIQVNGFLVAMKTKLWWVLQGPTTNAYTSTITQTISSLHIAALWDLESKLDMKDCPFSVDSSMEINPSGHKSLLVVPTEHFSDSLLYFSSYTNLLRMIAWILRFIFNCHPKITDKKRGILSSNEIEKAEMLVFRIIQKECFIDYLSYKNLCTIKDDYGCIRVKKKLFSEDLPTSYKNFKSIDWDEVLEETSFQRINLHLIAPASPWWRRWWELRAHDPYGKGAA